MKPISLREQDLAILRSTLGRFTVVREARIFGSRATGHARRASDIDLAVFAPDATPGEWAEICDALENAPIIYELDLVRPEQTASARLKEKLAREGIKFYPNETDKKGRP